MTKLRVLLIAPLAAAGLAVPGPAGAARDGDTYIVEPGDYLYGIARDQGVAIDDLLRANGLTLRSVIHPGQRLALPNGGTPTPTPTTPPPSGGRTYTVRAGDSLFAIAQRHGVSLSSLLAANRLSIASVIHPRQTLVIPSGGSALAPTPTPAPTPAPTPPTSGSTYTVRAGDSLYGISRRLGVTLDALLAANRLSVTSVIHPGQRLAVPGSTTPPPTTPPPTTRPPTTTPPTTPPPTTTPPTPTPPSGGTYTVKAGDSLYAISRHLGVPFAALLAANNMTATSMIHPGDRLVVPTGSAAAPPTVPPTTVPNNASVAEAERIIRDVWPDDLEDQAVAIARRESGLRPSAQNSCCVGLFQLYYDLHSWWLDDLGITSRSALFDARTNARAALALYQRAGWTPWAVTAPAPTAA